MVLCLVTISVSYLTIRARLNNRVPVMDTTHNRETESQQNVKLSRTLFIVITASLLFWIPGIVVNSTQYLCLDCVPLLVFQILNIFRLANSLVNPIIYSFRNPMFSETFKRAKLCKQSKEYTINYTPWGLTTAMELLCLVLRRSSLVWARWAWSCGPVGSHQALRSQMQRWRDSFSAIVRDVPHIEAKLWNEIIPRVWEISKKRLEKKTFVLA